MSVALATDVVLYEANPVMIDNPNNTPGRNARRSSGNDSRPPAR